MFVEKPQNKRGTHCSQNNIYIYIYIIIKKQNKKIYIYIYIYKRKEIMKEER